MRRTYPLDQAFELPRDDVLALVGGKAANLREMIGLGLPVPPGFVVTTETCRTFLGGGLAGRPRRGAAHADGRGRGGGRAGLRRRLGSLARQRPVGGAGVDARDDGHDPRPRAERRDRGRAGPRVRQRGVRAELSRAVRGQLPVDRRRRRRPRRSVAPAAARDRGRLPVVEQRPCPRVSREGGDRRRSRDRGHGPGDGLRQPRRDIGDRRRCSRATRRPASRPSTATCCSTRRARTSSPGRIATEPIAVARRAPARPSPPSCASTRRGSSITTPTCATSSSRSRTAGCGCSRSGSASAARRRRCGSRSTWPRTRRSRCRAPRRWQRVAPLLADPPTDDDRPNRRRDARW